MAFELEFMFRKQREFQTKLGFDVDNPTQEYYNLMFMAIVTEACECIEETAWKPWKKSSETDKARLAEEVIDLWHFVINLSLAAGLSAEDVFSLYCAKHNINLERQIKGY